MPIQGSFNLLERDDLVEADVSCCIALDFRLIFVSANDDSDIGIRIRLVRDAR